MRDGLSGQRFRGLRRQRLTAQAGTVGRRTASGPFF